jgi:hypothetical protein
MLVDPVITNSSCEIDIVSRKCEYEYKQNTPDVTTHVLFWRILLENQHDMVPAISNKYMYQHISKTGVTHIKPALNARGFQKFHKERFQLHWKSTPCSK